MANIVSFIQRVGSLCEPSNRKQVNVFDEIGYTEEEYVNLCSHVTKTIERWREENKPVKLKDVKEFFKLNQYEYHAIRDAKYSKRLYEIVVRVLNDAGLTEDECRSQYADI